MFRIVQTLKMLSFLCAGCCLACTPIPAESLNPSQSEYSPMGIGGRVTDRNGQPMSGAFVYAYRNAKSNLRGPADFEARVDDQGRFLLDLVEGEYYLVARMRQTGADAGPPNPGDAWALPPFNPVTVKTSEIVPIDFVLQSVTQPMLMREGTFTSGGTGFTGQLVDDQNQPLAG
ncbi:MAG: carboxypeptidase regulatory-like domain-containing protein, partial [Deltaproteobacteria bacterium]|nr:carboxypeptidase regulatory-like domain-containing protein [Deltaproteobacteria bacterium]